MFFDAGTEKFARDLSISSDVHFHSILKVQKDKLEFKKTSFAKLIPCSSINDVNDVKSTRDMITARDGLSFFCLKLKIVRLQEKTTVRGTVCMEVTLADEYGQISLTIWKESIPEFDFQLSDVIRKVNLFIQLD